MGAIELLEEAVNLLRSAPPGAMLMYLAGAIPFTLAALFFLNDVMRSPFAFDHLAAFSLGLALLYVWKNVWQALWAAELHAVLSPAKRPRNLWRVIEVQASMQPVGLALMLPFPWLVAFFRNVALFAALGKPDPVREARRQAVLWTRQNWAVLSIMTLAALLLFTNVLALVVFLPQLFRSFLGIEGELARLGGRIFNPTTVAVSAALTWLVIDPLLDAVYVLRCFYGASVATGEDLRAAFRRATGALVLLTVMLGAGARPAAAQVDPGRLDQSIDHVIHDREFTWRSPKPAAEDPKGVWVSWLRSIQNLYHRAIDWIAKIIDSWRPPKLNVDGNGKDTPVTARMLSWMIGIAVALVVGAAILFFLRGRAPVVEAQAVTITAAAVDLADESVTADQLPESSWLNLAEEWLARGDCRLALRALYLAGLNYLSQRELVSIRRWKSGLDYRREVDRRGRATPVVGEVFARNVAIFESGWYGTHAVDRAMVEAFASGLNEMRTHAERG